MGTAPMPGRSKAGFDDGHDGLMVTPQIDEAAETRSPGFSVFFCKDMFTYVIHIFIGDSFFVIKHS